MSQPLATTPATTPNSPYLNGDRIILEQERIVPFSSQDGSLLFERRSSTQMQGMGQLDTSKQVMSFILPDGTRVSSASEIANTCYKFKPGKIRRGCGPMTKDRTYTCARCIRHFCARHVWQPIFSANRYCLWCLGIKAVELSLRAIRGCFLALLCCIRGLWGLWFGLFSR